MACTLIIQSVVGQGQPNLLSVKVSGSATECSKVNVSIICTGSHAVTHSNVMVTNGAWETTFTEAEIKLAGCLKCGDPNYPITVRANCADPNSNCSDLKTFSSIPCETACPTITHIEADIPTCDEVLAAGGWNVTFNAQISNLLGVGKYIWNFDDGSPSVEILAPNNGAVIQHKYQCPGNYNVTLTILSNCEPFYTDDETIEIELPSCGCPTVSSFTAEVDENNSCTWCFEAKVGSPFVQCIDNYLWNFDDEHTEYTEIPKVCHTYSSDGTYNVTLTLLGGVGQAGGGPCSYSKEIEVTNCKERGGNGNGHPCKPWWHPKCWWNCCGILLAAALAAMVSAAVLFIAWSCTITPLLPVGAIPLLVAAIAAAALGLLLLGWWGWLCAKTQCHILCTLIHAVEVMILLQALIAIILSIVSPPCSIGAWISSGYYGTALVLLLHINEEANCHCHPL